MKPAPAESTSADKLYTSEEAAGRLGVHPYTLIVWRNRGVGPPYIKFPDGHASVRYRASDLQAWLDRGYVSDPKAASEARKMMRIRAQAGTQERVENDCLEHGVTVRSTEVRDVVSRASRPRRKVRRPVRRA